MRALTFRQWFHRNVYLQTPYWKWVRRGVARRAGYMCQARGCTQRGPHLDAHHVTYHPWLEWLMPWTMLYLCRFHHNETHRGFSLWLKNGRRLPPFGYS